ncbi:MAG: sodium:proton antiporter NhaD [Dechloromonas sp.]|uniref:sodium:proton antiporter NhaD n=1 Tax=Dechloromonas sp. CZR5 TaxID=2608630 RepID=UPI00123E256F|nr:sodium:proton antiporter NhaD [Dechloromonas sp. CZR5]MBS4020134.1 sodium:proton antiporter NhaD [Dechloromonas sp.]
MLTAMIVIFVLAYTAIALEHPLKVNKSASALVAAGLLWTLYAMSQNDPYLVAQHLGESLTDTAQIVFFLMGAMAIVELVDAHNGFDVITRRIRTSTLSSLMWMVAGISFFLSTILDNLTTTIVMISLMRKILARQEDRLLFAGIIVIAANSGGAWSPIGDVTTTMLWIGGQISVLATIQSVFLPSLVSLIVPLAMMAHTLRGRRFDAIEPDNDDPIQDTTEFERKLMFFLGLGVLIAVPAFKTITHLPPFTGVLFGLGILWMAGDLVHREKDESRKQPLTLAHALSRIDMSSLVFFVGILLSVAVLEHTHILASLAQWLNQAVGRVDVIVLVIGIVSAIVDNVPLVAASMGMYSLTDYPPDHLLWGFLAYCAGTGGSILIIGSAAGVAAMGLEKIRFFWYVQKISGLALTGYLAGAVLYLAMSG